LPEKSDCFIYRGAGAAYPLFKEKRFHYFTTIFVFSWLIADLKKGYTVE
jgi:hypothetical protein